MRYEAQTPLVVGQSRYCTCALSIQTILADHGTEIKQVVMLCSHCAQSGAMASTLLW